MSDEDEGVPPKLNPGDPGYMAQIDEVSDTFGMFFDRQNNPLTMRQWGELRQKEPYYRLASDYLDDGHIWVSTVWIGMDVAPFRHGGPHCFETMVFVEMTEEQQAEKKAKWRQLGFSEDDCPWEGLERWNYATEDEARDHHREVVESLRVKTEIFAERVAEELEGNGAGA